MKRKTKITITLLAIMLLACSSAIYTNEPPSSSNSQKKQFSCPAQGCTKLYPRKDHVLRHIRAVHTEQKHRCNTCNMLFAYQSNLQRHNKEFHDKTNHKKKRKKTAKRDLLKPTQKMKCRKTNPIPASLTPTPPALSIPLALPLSYPAPTPQIAIYNSTIITNYNLLTTSVPTPHQAIATHSPSTTATHTLNSRVAQISELQFIPSATLIASGLYRRPPLDV